MMFSRAIVRTPGRSMIRGLTLSNLGFPDPDLAKKQHRAYIQALESCGLEVFVMEADEDHPDSTFVEDTAILTPECAIITNPGAPSRQGEVTTVRALVERFFNRIEEIQPPGTVEGGDIMMVGSHFYIGLSERTNEEGANQVTRVKVWCGALSHMTRAHFAEHFELAAKGTLAEHATLDITISDDPAHDRAQDVVLESIDVAD